MRFQKTARSTVFFWGASRKIFENVTLVARRRKHFRGFVGDDFVADLTQKKKYFHTQEFTCILSTSVVTASRHALWRVVSNQVISALGHCWVHTPHIHAYTLLSETLCIFKVVCFPPSWSRQVTWIMSIEALLFNSLGQFTRLRADDRVYDSSH